MLLERETTPFFYGLSEGGVGFVEAFSHVNCVESDRSVSVAVDESGDTSIEVVLWDFVCEDGTVYEECIQDESIDEEAGPNRVFTALKLGSYWVDETLWGDDEIIEILFPSR